MCHSEASVNGYSSLKAMQLSLQKVEGFKYMSTKKLLCNFNFYLERDAPNS